MGNARKFADASAAFNSGGLIGTRNRFINGNGIIQQRANLALSSAATGYAADRWIAGLTTGTSIAGLVFTSAFGGSSSGKGIYVGGSYTNGTPYFAQRIESLNTQDLNNSNVIVSGLLWQDTGSSQTMLLRLIKPSAADNYASAAVLATKTVVVPSGVATPFSAIFTLGASDAVNGLQFDVQSNSPVTVTSKNFGISDMQFEKGSIQTAYDFRFVQTELALAQRYLQIYPPGSLQGLNRYVNVGLGSGSLSPTFNFPVVMRAAPSTNLVTAAFDSWAATGSPTYTLRSSTTPSGVTFAYSSTDNGGSVLASGYFGFVNTQALVLNAEI